jgi:hypothetical protein
MPPDMFWNERRLVRHPRISVILVIILKNFHSLGNDTKILPENGTPDARADMRDNELLKTKGIWI